jgi:hypothetical protein
LNEHETELVSLIYGNEQFEIKYDVFLADCAEPLTYIINAPYSGVKSTYVAKFIDFDGNKEMQDLMVKVKECAKRERIRLLEFF